MIKYQKKITDISLVNDTISTYQKNRYLKCRYDTDISISTIYRLYFWYIDPPLLHTYKSKLVHLQQQKKISNKNTRKMCNTEKY